MKLHLLCFALLNNTIPIDFVSIHDLTQPQCEQIMTGTTPHRAVFLPKGTQIPIQFDLSGDLAHLENGTGLLCVDRDMYARFENEEPFFSLDGNTWHPLLELATGSIALSLHPQEEGPTAALIADVRMR